MNDNNKNEFLETIHNLNLPIVKIIKANKKDLDNRNNESYYHKKVETVINV